jgi:hypothetical protein
MPLGCVIAHFTRLTMNKYAEEGLAVAKEALKPVSSVIDALLGPKIARLKSWSLHRDVASRAEHFECGAPFASYLTRLLKRAAGVTTLVFPQQVLLLPALYEPLKLEARDHGEAVGNSLAQRSDGSQRAQKRRYVTESSLVRSSARTCIIDGAGMGKTTFTRHLILRELVSGSLIPLFLELRRIADGTTLLESLARDLDELDKPFDRDVFLHLLQQGRFLIVLDGLDEVASDARGRLCAEIEELSSKAPQSAIVLTSRPEVGLPTMSKARLLTFAPLSVGQAKNVVRRYDAIGGIDVGERLISRFDSLPDQFLRTPLLVALLYRSFGYNGAVSTKITSFYDELYAALYKGHDLTKSGFARAKQSGLDYEAFRQLLRGFAFLMIARQRVTLSTSSAAIQLIEEARALTGVHPGSCAAFLDDLLLAVPLLVRDGSELRFAHKTIGEYFAAEYLCYTQGGGRIAHDMRLSDRHDRFYETLSFVREINPSLFKRVVAKPIGEAFLAHMQECPLPALRTLLFVAPESRCILSVESSNPRSSDDLDLPHVQSFYVHARIEKRGLKFRLRFAVGGAKQPLVGTVASLFCVQPQKRSVPIDWETFADLPEGEWFRLDDPFVATSRWAASLELVCSDLTAIYLNQGRGDRTHGDKIVFAEHKIHAILRELQEEEQAQSLISVLLGNTPTLE